MRTRQILMSTPMVLALLAGRKTQTRRLMKPQPVCNGFGKPGEDTGWEIPCYQDSYPPSAMLWPDENGGVLNGDAGSPWWGYDELWVQEAHRVLGSTGPSLTVEYASDKVVRTCDVTPREYELFRARRSALGSSVSGRFMYRSISRISLTEPDATGERLQAVTKDDAKAEGIERIRVPPHEAWKNYLFETAHPRRGVVVTDQRHRIMGYESPCASYTSLWDSINGEGSWKANPWVWKISFKVIAK